MSNNPLLEPIEVPITMQDGKVKTFILSKFPAVAGREIISAYPVANMPKLGDYATSEDVMLKLMAHVAVPIDGSDPLRLSTVALVNNHARDWETLAQLEMKMLEYNCSFFQAGALPGFIELLLEKATPILSQILTASLRALSQAATPDTPNSETN